MLKYFRPSSFDRRLLFGRPMLGRLAKVEHRLHAVSLELRKLLDARLSAGAELRIDLEEVAECGSSA